MEKYPPNEIKKIVNGELERILKMSINIGLIPRPTEEEKIDLINGMYLILSDYASLKCNVCSKVKDYQCK